MADLNIDTTQHEDPAPYKGSSTPLPPGGYTVTIVRTALKKTKPGTPSEGMMVEVEFDISFPSEFSNRKHWERFNIVNPYLDESGRLSVQEDAKKKLAQLGRACGVMGNLTEEELLGKSTEADIIVKKKKPWTDKNGVVHENEMENSVTKYYPVGSVKSVTAISAQPSKPNNWGAVGTPVVDSAAAPSESAPPWGKK